MQGALPFNFQYKANYRHIHVISVHLKNVALKITTKKCNCEEDDKDGETERKTGCEREEGSQSACAGSDKG